ncbi:hypothetical protein DAHU10_026130 [Hanseniaspora uvarum]|nr:hypothetical protein DAHU10_026130 [Hanseniaspora uvarum]
MEYGQYTQTNFGNNSEFINEQFNNATKQFLDQVYDHVSTYMPVIMPAMKYIAQHFMNFRILTSILLIYFNMKKIKTFWKLYITFHLIIISIYVYNRTVVKLINDDIPLLYEYMNKHGDIELTIKRIYKNYFLAALSDEHKKMVDDIISHYLKAGLQIVLIPIQTFVIRTLQDVESFLHSF